jgi:predicted acyltransferase
MSTPSVETMSPTPAVGAPSASPASQRLVSLDVLRGFTMFWLMGGKALVLAVTAIAGVDWVNDQLQHSAWEGVRYYDLIWPTFMLMVGVAIPFSFTKRSATQSRAEILRHAWRRAAVLFLLGSLRESMHDGVPRLIELSSALQPIAIAYLVASYFAGAACRWQLGVTAGIFVGYALLLAFVPAPGVAAGTYEVNRNLVTAVDQAVLGRAHKDGWGTVLSTLPTIATTMIGLLLGRVLLSAASPLKKLKTIALTGAGCVVAGYALSPVIPVIMKLWTSTYGLITAGWACLLFAFFYWLVDVRGWRRGTFFFVVIGANALAAYMLPAIIPLRRTVGIFTAPLATALGLAGPLLASGAVVAVGWLILSSLYRRRIFLAG